MTTILRIPSVLWKIGLAFAVIRLLMDVFGVASPEILNVTSILPVFVFLDINFLIGMGQVFGSLAAMIAYGFKLPSAENYACKVDYILPFEGKWTVFNGGVDKEHSHSWGIVAQRYAYDFIIMNDEGKSFRGDNKSLQSYYCYGKNLLAPADGTVVKVSGNHKDSRVTGTKVFCDTWDIRGNFIVIKHAEKEYSVLAHLIPNSITVQVGDRVHQGQVIGKCGNSGNTSEPHLHFQLQSGKSFFASAGLPISFVNINAHEKTNYGLADSRSALKQAQQAESSGRVYIGRGLEVENEK